MMTLRTGPPDQCHLLDWVAGSIKQVTRATFTSETLAAIASTDQAIVTAFTLHEIEHGPLSPSEGRQRIEDGTIDCIVDVYVDAMSLIAALQATKLATLTERSFAIHLLWLKERLAAGLPRSMVWCDTRDMLADGLTKGSIDRTQIRLAAQGQYKLVHKHSSC
jgi:hypothetical protein